jgi:hypothetical protein
VRLRSSIGCEESGFLAERVTTDCEVSAIRSCTPADLQYE